MSNKALTSAVLKIRTELGATRKEFASAIGCSPETVRSVETRPDYELTGEMATRISIATGASRSALLKGKSLDCEGRPFSREYYIAYVEQGPYPIIRKRVLIKLGFDETEKLIASRNQGKAQHVAAYHSRQTEAVLGWARLLLETAQGTNQFTLAWGALVDCLDATMEKYGLTKAVTRELKSRSGNVRVTWRPDADEPPPLKVCANAPAD